MNKQSWILIVLSFVWNKQSSLRFNHSYIWNKQRSLRFASIFLKGVWHEIFDLRFFSLISVPQAPKCAIRAVLYFWKFAEIFKNECLSLVSMTPAISCSAVSTTPAKNLLLVSTIAGVVDTGDKFIAGDNDTGDNFIAGDNDTGEQLSPVTTTPVINYCWWQEQGRCGGGELPKIEESWKG